MTIPCPLCGGVADIEVDGMVQEPDSRIQGDSRKGNKRGILIKGRKLITTFFACRSCEWCHDTADDAEPLPNYVTIT